MDHPRRTLMPRVAQPHSSRISYLQFEALLSAARESASPNDFALVAMLGLLGLRTFEATGADLWFMPGSSAPGPGRRSGQGGPGSSRAVRG
jgi:hypothetical protein